jgi:hypothetical protein
MEKDLFTGKWRFVPDRSALAMPVPLQWIQQIEATARGISVVETITYASGRFSTVSVHARFDGNYFPVAGSPLADEIAYLRIDAWNISATAKKQGAVTITEIATVSEDLKALAFRFSIHAPDGKAALSLAVFERTGEAESEIALGECERR